MKWFKRIVLVLILVVVVGLGALYFYRNSVIRNVVETQASNSLGVKTTLGSANLAPFGGTLALGDLKIGSPKGYKAEQMFTLGGLDLGVNYGDLRKDPVRVSKIVIDRPKAVLEMVDGKFNFQALMDQLAGPKTTPPPAPTPSDNPPAPAPKPADPSPAPGDQAQPKKMIIDELTLKDAEVEVRAPLLPSPVTVKIPSVTLKQIGNADGAQNGAAIKDVVAASMSALAASAANSPDLLKFGDLNKMLASQAQQVMGNVQKELAKQVGDMTKNLTGEVNKVIGGTGIDVGKVVPGGAADPAKAVNEGLGNLLGGGDKKKDDEKKKDRK